MIASDSPFVLVAHSDGTLAGDISRTLRGDGYKVLTVCCAAEALKHWGKHRPDVILLDLFLPPSATRGIPAAKTKAAAKTATDNIIDLFMDVLLSSVWVFIER